MDAKRTPRWVWGGTLLAISGCMFAQTEPAARREEPRPAEQAEPAQIVALPPAPATQPAEDVLPAVRQYIERLESVVARPPALADVPPASPLRPQLVSDEAPAAQQTADPPTASVPQPSAPGGQVELPAPTAEPPAAPSPAPNPPVLSALEVRAEPAAVPASSESGPPTVNASAVARGAPFTLRDYLARAPATGDDSFQEQLDRRLLSAIAGEYEQAREPLQMATAEEQELASRLVEACLAVRDWHMGDPARAAESASQQLTPLLGTLRRLTDLRIPRLAVCSAVRGYGQYDEIDPPRFAAGTSAEFVLYCELDNFASETRDGFSTTIFDLTTTILDHAGTTVIEFRDTDIVDRCRNPRRDCFVPRLVRLPAALSPGQYVAKVTVVDKLAHKVAEARAPFQLVARP